MEILSILIVIAAIVGGVFLIAALLMGWRPGRLHAFAPAAAGVVPTDTAAEARSKRAQYHQLLEAIRILTEVKTQDANMPILDTKTRDDIEAFLAYFYSHN